MIGEWRAPVRCFQLREDNAIDSEESIFANPYEMLSENKENEETNREKSNKRKEQKKIAQ